ncbi:uncharacterized protein LOC101219994 [Cucumis sativus]|uniref:SET domain-containing protein n=1 Tax=Cucumis sativus TaxID=3659 RepID=A0A0A0LCB3_CUCSA|nr:uncharacterized protein LOC101219994 [Cucumis sativus]KGN58554.1 hypothetical protein Csa_002445 [Cucumis sativus]
MAFLFQKFQEAVKVLAKNPLFTKNPLFARDPRRLQFEADMNRLFLFTSYNRLGMDATEADAEEIIDMASKASFADQQKQVQENIHSQVKSFCMHMDGILLPDEPAESPEKSKDAVRKSGLSFAVGRTSPPTDMADTIPTTRPLGRSELSQQLKDEIGYTLDIKPSRIPHKHAGQGLFIDGEADVGSIIAIYPGVVYSPAHYQYIPGYPRVDAQNPYLITRYDGTVINAQPWGLGADTREVWHGLTVPNSNPTKQGDEKSDRLWRMLSKPLEAKRVQHGRDAIERRNPLAFAHFANHPAKDMVPNVMLCPYDFPLTEKDMRVYIPNVPVANEEVGMKRFGSFWFKSGRSRINGSDTPILKTIVLVATRALCNEEVLLNYRLSNSKRRPSWYTPVDEGEDRRRWS